MSLLVPDPSPLATCAGLVRTVLAELGDLGCNTGSKLGRSVSGEKERKKEREREREREREKEKERERGR